MSEMLKITVLNNSLRVNSSDLATTDALTMEVSRASSVENALSNDISNEVLRATSAEASLLTTLSVESSLIAARITNVVGTAPSLLDTLAEIATALSNDPNVVNVLQSGIQSEVSRATSVETTLSTGLSSEVSRAVSADASLSTGLSSEVSRAVSAEASLSTGLSSEVSRAVSADASLTAALSGNISCAALSCTTLTPSSLITASRITEKLTLAGGSGTAWTMDFNTGNVFYATPTGNFTVTISNIPVSASNQYTITLLGNASNYCTGATITGLTTTFRNASNTTPTISSAAVVVHSFTVIQCFGTNYVIYTASPY